MLPVLEFYIHEIIEHIFVCVSLYALLYLFFISLIKFIAVKYTT